MCKMIISNPHSDPLSKMTWFWRAELLRPVSNRPALWFRSSTASYFNKYFFVNSPWHCASFTNDIHWTILRHDLNQIHQIKHSFPPLILITDSNMWLCQKVTSVYCVQCRQDSGRDWSLYLLFDGTRHSYSAWSSVGGAYGEKKTIGRCLALEAVFMQMFVPLWCHHAPEIQTELD